MIIDVIDGEPMTFSSIFHARIVELVLMKFSREVFHLIIRLERALNVLDLDIRWNFRRNL